MNVLHPHTRTQKFLEVVPGGVVLLIKHVGAILINHALEATVVLFPDLKQHLLARTRAEAEEEIPNHFRSDDLMIHHQFVVDVGRSVFNCLKLGYELLIFPRGKGIARLESHSLG